MMNKILRKTFACASLLGLTLSTSSCFLENFFLILKPLEFKVIAQKGSASLSLAAYYQDSLMTLSDDLVEIENAFKVNDESSYQFIVYDAVRGLDLCEEYQNFAYVGTIALGNQQLIPLHDESNNTDKSIKILLNNELGSLGKTLKKIADTNSNFEITFVDYSDLEFYNYLYSTNDDLASMYDYCMISEPYATRLMVMSDSNLYNEEYDIYTNSKDTDYDISKSQYCKSLRSIYRSYSSLDNNAFGIPQTGIFVNKESYYKNQNAFDTVLTMLNAEIDLKYVMDVSNTRVDFRALSEEYHDESKDENSAQTQLAYKVQFDKVGISWNEAKRLQAWHPVLGKDAPFNKFVNRLEYVEDIVKYFKADYMSFYYNFIGEDLPSSENFINISIK